MMKAKKPRTWRKVTMPSTRGNFRKSMVFAKIARSNIAQESKAVCH